VLGLDSITRLNGGHLALDYKYPSSDGSVRPNCRRIWLEWISGISNICTRGGGTSAHVQRLLKDFNRVADTDPHHQVELTATEKPKGAAMDHDSKGFNYVAVVNPAFMVCMKLPNGKRPRSRKNK
jgi:hypothetical protein